MNRSVERGGARAVETIALEVFGLHKQPAQLFSSPIGKIT